MADLLQKMKLDKTLYFMLSIFPAWCKDQTQRNTTLQILSKFNDALIMYNELLDWNLEEKNRHCVNCLVFSLNILRNPFSPPMGPVSPVCFIYFFCFGTGIHLSASVSIINKTTFQKTSCTVTDHQLHRSIFWWKGKQKFVMITTVFWLEIWSDKK